MSNDRKAFWQCPKCMTRNTQLERICRGCAEDFRTDVITQVEQEARTLPDTYNKARRLFDKLNW
jgi:hypothetical protein